MKKTLVLFTSSFPYTGGEQFLETEIDYLAKQFKKIIIVPMKKSNNIRITPDNVVVDNFVIYSKTRHIYKIKSLFSKYFVKTVSLNFSELKYLFSFMIYIERYMEWLNKLLEDNNVSDYLFYTYWFGASTSALSLVKDKTPKLKFVTRVHRGDLYENFLGLNQFPGRKHVVSNINMLFPISDDGKSHLMKKYSVPEAKINVSRLGVRQSEPFSTDSKDETLHVVSCSGLTQVKRVDLIIKALSQLKLKNVDVLWTHIGDGVLKKQLEQQAKSLLNSNIEFIFLGNLTNKNVFKFYKTSSIDVFINVSSSEGIPVSIMEAQSFGIPVIATDVGGSKEIVNFENGYLLSSNPLISEITNVLISVVNEKKDWEEKRSKSYKNWKNKYNAESNYKSFANLLNTL